MWEVPAGTVSDRRGAGQFLPGTSQAPRTTRSGTSEVHRRATEGEADCRVSDGHAAGAAGAPTPMTSATDGSTVPAFTDRHIGPRDAEIATMLETVGFESLMALARPPSRPASQLGRPRHHRRGLEHAVVGLRDLARRNTVVTSMIGMGYYGTITSVIQRNVLRPGLVHAYTPYQPEISRAARALLNFRPSSPTSPPCRQPGRRCSTRAPPRPSDDPHRRASSERRGVSSSMPRCSRRPAPSSRPGPGTAAPGRRHRPDRCATRTACGPQQGTRTCSASSSVPAADGRVHDGRRSPTRPTGRGCHRGDRLAPHPAQGAGVGRRRRRRHPSGSGPHGLRRAARRIHDVRSGLERTMPGSSSASRLRR